VAAAPTPENEGARLAALRRHAVLDTPADEIFDRLTRLASSILGTPIALISLVDESRQWFASAVGLDIRSTPRDVSFCAHAILGSDVLVVPDATTDARFRDNPLVVGDLSIRFYAGAPLTTSEGFRLGTLCALDRRAREGGLTPIQTQQLRDLAALVVDQLERRRDTVESVERDTTERHARLAALQESEQRYRLLFHANPQPMWVYDSETLAFLDVNAAAEAMYGYSRDEFLSRTLLDIRPPEEVEHVRQAAARVPPGIARSGPWRHLRKDGHLLFVRISSYPATFEGRRARLVLAHDITAEKELEEQLVQAQKMEAVGQLAGGVAHDFNNLLTVINGYARLLMARLHAADPLRADAGHILQAGERAASLTQQLLAFSRRQVLQPRPLDVGRVIDHLRPMLGRLLREDIDVRTTVPSSLPPVMVDPVQLEQVLLNLAINGSDAMPDGGTLSLDAGEVVVDADMAERQGLPQGRYVALAMSDTGAGMTEETRGRIFEPFFTTKAKGRGSGLGLPVAYGIVRQSGGTIVVHTTPGEGSTFTVYLPLADAPVMADQAAAPADVARLSGHETVLVVEDHEAVRCLAADVLRAHGYQVLVAEHGQEAIALVEARGGKVDLVLTDVVMPRMGGREVATSLQQRVPGLGVLFMSGYTQSAIVQNGALESGLNFLAKPFMPVELLARVREVLAARTAGAGDAGPDRAPMKVTSAAATPRRIVVADDEPGLRLLLAATLSGAGYDVIQADNGLEAVRLCEGGRVDLLLTDLVMPDHEGLETIRRMRAERPDIPVVAMSGALDGERLDVARAMGAAAVIEKPFTPDHVVKVVARILAEHATPSSNR
jgi:PAS domain S-box-containing protein